MFRWHQIKHNNNNQHIDVCFLSYKKKSFIFLILAMMNSYNDLMMPNNNGPSDYHQYTNTNPLDLPYSPDLFMSPGQQSVQNRHMNVMQHQQPPPPHPQSAMHQV